jgi:hypothetical protein
MKFPAENVLGPRFETAFRPLAVARSQKLAKGVRVGHCSASPTRLDGKRQRKSERGYSIFMLSYGLNFTNIYIQVLSVMLVLILFELLLLFGGDD